MTILESINWGSVGRVPVHLQSEATECGHACIAMVASYYGHAVSVAEVRAAFPPSQKGSSLNQLMAIAKAMDLETKAVKLDLAALPDLPLPAVLHWDFVHFVVLVKVTKDSATVHDPALGSRTMPLAEFSKHFTGVALQLKPADGFKAKSSSPALRVRDLLGRVRGFGSSLTQVLFFALILELIGLAMPMLGQVITDDVLPNSERSLLTVLGVGFLMLVAVRAGVSYIRDWALALVSVGLKAQVSERVFRHTLRLHPQYFERRSSADVASRFESLAAIERTLASSFIEALLDGAFATIILCLLFSYSIMLGLVVTISIAVFAVIRCLTFRPMRELEMRIVEARARQSGSMLETLRAIIPLQLADKTSWRLAQWGIHLSEGTNSELTLARANAALSGARSGLLGISTVVFTWLAASLALDGTITLGSLFAALAYQNTVSTRLVAFVEKVLSIRMLGVHLERLSDIVYAEPQPKDKSGAELAPDEPVVITLKDVRFRYSPTDPEILKGVNLTVKAGEHVALTGASGCGKTTLMKLMLGIVEPTGGEILFNGQPLRSFGIDQQRAITGAVLQDDTLFMGTVKDNISYFDPNATDEDVAKAANLAGIHAEIAAMPMNYMTLIGEGSGSLSGGQRQRLFLARAIYREPKVLMLDEATSHLDLKAESVVNAGIATLKATRISIAHRPESLLAAERIIVLHGGEIVQEFTSAQFLRVLRGQPPEPVPAA